MPTSNQTFWSERHAMARTACPVQVTANSTIIAAGAAAQWTISFLEPAQLGDTYLITFGSRSVLMQCGPTMSAPNTFQPGATTAQSAQNLYLALINQLDIDTHFTVSHGGGATVFFLAKVRGSEFNLLSVVSTPPGRVNFNITTTGIDPQRAPSISVGLILHVDAGDSTPFPRVATLTAVPDANGRCEFDLGPLLEPHVRDVEQLPYVDTLIPKAVRLIDTRKNFYFRTWERFGDPAVDRPLSPLVSGLGTAVYAGIERIERMRFNAWYSSARQLPNKWLTWRGRAMRREVVRNEQVWISCYNAYTRVSTGTGSFEALRLYSQVHYADAPDGPWVPRVLDSDATGVKTGEYASWPAGWDMLNITASGGTPVGYSLQIRGATSNVVISETYRFDLVDPDYNELHFQFVSSLGVWESLRTTGAWKRARAAEYLVTRRELTAQEVGAGKVGAYTSLPLKRPMTLEVTTAPSPLEEHQAIMDILGSPAIRLVDHANKRFVPLRIVEAQEHTVAKRGVEDEHIHSTTIRFVQDDPTDIVSIIPPLAAIVETEPETPDDGLTG